MALATAAILLPGLLLVLATLPHWEHLRRLPQAQAAMRGANTAVVGVPGRAVYTPVATGAIASLADAAVAAAALLALVRARTAPMVILVSCVAAALALNL